jgi:tetratricopeptide (TPR) repeat protein
MTIKYDKAIQALKEAISLAENMCLPPRQIVMIYHWLTEALFWKFQYDDVIRYGEKGLQLLGDDTECMEAALMNTCMHIQVTGRGIIRDMKNTFIEM